MKLKDAFLGFCIVALIVSEFYIYSANQNKKDALAKAKTAQFDADQARSELEQLKSATATQTTDNARLRSENQRLSQKITQLQNDSARLGKTNQLLAQQLGSLRDYAEQQQGQLQLIQVQNQQAQAETERRACIHNLQLISAAKAAWALDNNKPATATPTVDDLSSYFPNGVFPVCPSGGIYMINAIGVAPACSIPGHVLPPQ